PGASIIQYFWVEGQDAADAINDIVASEGPPAFATVSDAGYFVFRDRHHRLLQSNAGEVQATFTADGQEPCFSPPADINGGWKDIINLLNLTAVPRSCAVTENEAALSPAPVVWEAAEGSTRSIPSGETITLKIDCDRPIVRFVGPEENANALTRSGGNVLFTCGRESGPSTQLTIQAPAEPVALTNLRVRGYAANDFGNVIVA